MTVLFVMATALSVAMVHAVRKGLSMHLPLVLYHRLLLTYLGPHWPRVLALTLLLLATVALQIVNPQILRYVLDTAQHSGALPTLIGAAVLFLVIGTLTQVVAAGTAYISADVGWRATNRLRTDLVGHCLHLDPPFHATHMPGDLSERICGDVSALASFLSQFAVSLLGSALLVLGILLALFHEDASVGLVFSAFTLLTLVVLHRVRGVATPDWIVGRQASADLFAFVEERLVGIDDLRANNAVADTMLRLARVQRAYFRARRAARMMSEIPAGSTGVLLTLGSVGALALGAYLFTLHRATIGAVYLILTYTGLLLSDPTYPRS